MAHLPRRLLCGIAPLLACLGLAGCIDNADGSSDARVRVLNLSTGYPSIDLYSNDGDSAEDTAQFEAVALGTISDYRTLRADTYTLKFRRAGKTANLFTRLLSLAEDMHITFVAVGDTNQFAVLAVNEDAGDPDEGYAQVQVGNTTASGSLDVYFTDADELLEDVSPDMSGITAGMNSPTAVKAGTYRMRVTGAGSKTDVRLNVPQITLQEGSVVSVVLTATEGNVLLNAAVLPRAGQPVFYANTESARLRVLNVSVGYESLDLYTNDGTTPADVQRLTGIANGTASAYTPMTAASYTLNFRKTGASGTLLSQQATFVEDTHATYVAWGNTNRFALQPISDDEEAAKDGYTRLRVLNTTSSNTLDIYLTGAGDELDDVAPVVREVAPGNFPNGILVPSGSYRLRVTGTGDKKDLRLDVPAVELESTAVVTLVVTDTPGGILTGAVVMPQRAEPVAYGSGVVRVRGAAGLSMGAAVTLEVGGTEIIRRQAARSHIAPSYVILPAAQTTATVYVDDVAVASGPVSLLPGRDYTLLAWDDGGAVQMTLVPDDNHVASGGRPRLRLLNGMSGLAAPLSLSVDYLPVAEYIDVGSPSEYAEINAGTGYRLDVTNAQTLEALLTRESVSLQSGGIYTFLLAGGGPAPVAGTLRRDR